MNPIVESAVVRATALPISAVQLSPRPPLDYQSNRLYDLWVKNQHWIVKEFLRPAEWQDAPRREFGTLEILAQLEIAPRPVFYDPAVGPVVIYEYMPGEMWDRRRPTARDLALLAELWLKMGEVSTDRLWVSRGMERTVKEAYASFETSFRMYANWTEAEFPAGQCAASLCLELFAERMSAMQEIVKRVPRLCFCRGDPRFANVIARPDGRLGMVDWEDNGLGDPARDIADLMLHPNQEDLLSTEEWNAFLEPYLAVHTKLDDEFLDRMDLYQGIYPVFFLSVLLRFGIKRANEGQLAGWTINDMPANERLRRYLNRGLAWRKPDLPPLGNIEFFPSLKEHAIQME